MYARPAMDSSRWSAIRCVSDGEMETVSDAHSCVTDRRSAAVGDATDTPSHTRTNVNSTKYIQVNERAMAAMASSRL